MGVIGEDRSDQQDLFLLLPFALVFHRHSVLCQGACLVRADDGHTAQPLDSRKLLDDGVLISHAGSADGQRDGNDGGQGLRNGRDRQGNSKQERVHKALAPVEGQTQHHDADQDDGDGELLAEVVHGDLQRCLALAGVVHQAGDASKLCVLSNSGDDDPGSSVGDQRSGEDHVVLIAQGHLLLDQLAGFLCALRFPRERRLIHLQGEVLDDSTISRNDIPSLQQDDVAADQVCRIDDLLLSIPDHASGGGGEFLQAFQRFLRLDSLGSTQDGIQDQDGDDHQGAFQVAGSSRDQCRNDQDDHQQILELLQKNLQGGFRLLFLKFVFAVLGAVLGHVGQGQATFGGAKFLHDLLRFMRVKLVHISSSFVFFEYSTFSERLQETGEKPYIIITRIADTLFIVRPKYVTMSP